MVRSVTIAETTPSQAVSVRHQVCIDHGNFSIFQVRGALNETYRRVFNYCLMWMRELFTMCKTTVLLLLYFI